MKALTSIFRRKHRPRTARSFAATCATLEGRALLSASTAPVAMVATSLSPVPLVTSSTAHFHDAFPGPQPGSNGPDGGGNPGPPDHSKDHVDLDVKPDGRGGPEFAIADASESKVFVRFGMNGPSVTLDGQQGIDKPQSVTLADLNADGILDLIVANTGASNVLVFPGLSGGKFGPPVNGDGGYLVGQEPVSVSVTYAEGNSKKADLLVANEGSDSVTILDGQYNGGVWTATPGGTIATGSEPVRAFAYDLDADGTPDLLVCNYRSDDVTMYQGGVNGSFADTATATIAVGSHPEAMILGTFEKRSQLDMVTVNSGSDDLTFVADAFGAHQTSRTISSGGTMPDAAFAIDPGQSGVLDLVVANGGDGRVALFRGGGDGLQLAGVINQANVPSPTSLAPSTSGDGVIDFFAASAGDDAALSLQFDLGIASTFLPGTASESAAIGQGDGELYAQLMSLDGSSLELVAVFSAGSPDSEAIANESNLREPSTITALYTPTEGQGEDAPAKLPEGSSGPSTPLAGAVDPSKVEDSPWDRFVLGDVKALDRPLGLVEAVAARDLPEEDIARPIEGLASLGLDRRPGDRPFDVDAGPGLVDEALRLFWSGGTPGGREAHEPAASPSKLDAAPELDGIDAPPIEVRLEVVPLVSAALAASTRLILKASPPRPSTFGKKPGPRPFVSRGHDPEAKPRPNPV